MKRRNLAALLLAVGAVATGTESEQENGWMWGDGAGKEQPFRQTLVNRGDAQYLTSLNIGGQDVEGILDTGSFDLVVFPATCDTCGHAGKYNSANSRTFFTGGLTSTQTYGSGTAEAKEAFDLVKVGQYAAVNQSFWHVNKAAMPLLFQAEFQAIIGVGPPETPAADAWAYALKDINDVLAVLEAGRRPAAQQVKMAGDSIKVANKVVVNPPLLQSFQTDVFSICIGAHSGDNGYFVWKDDAPFKKKDVFTRVPVIGQHTWSVRLHSPRLKQNASGFLKTTPANGLIDIDLSSGNDDYTALVDSGTSLLAVPPHVYAELDKFAKSLDEDCSNLEEFPDLVFHLGDMEVVLPPTSYISKVTGSMASSYSSFVRIRRNPERPTCMLLAMEIGSTTEFGAAWVLGVPFLRQYYSSFQVGKDTDERAMHFARAGKDCDPSKERPTELSPSHVHSVDLSKLYMPRRLQPTMDENSITV